MGTRLAAICFTAHDVRRVAGFWSGLLGWPAVDEPGGAVLVGPGPGGAIPVRVIPGGEPKTTPNPMHFDLTSTSLADQQARVTRALELGGRHIDVGQLPEERHVVLADPDGNELCVIEPTNNFLAGCGLVGALACDGAAQVGYFWHHALDWPLVWDQDEETAIQSPAGGTKITWGGPRDEPKRHVNRVHFDIAPTEPTAAGEVERLLALGATRVEPTHVGVAAVALADPDGNEFCLLDALV